MTIIAQVSSSLCCSIYEFHDCKKKINRKSIGNPMIKYKVCLITVGNPTHLKRGERFIKLIVHIVLKKPFTLFF